MTRYEKLNKPAIREAAERIALLALDEESQGGKPVLFLTKFQIAKTLDMDEQTVSMALRLASTAEWSDEEHWSFILPGNGRSGERYGYVLQHDRAITAETEAKLTLSDTDMKLADHLRGVAAHWRLLKVAHGANTRTGRNAKEVEEILTGAAAHVERTLREEG